MEFTDIDKKNIEKMYKKYGEKLVSKIVKKQDKLKMSESLRSTVRKMRKQEGGANAISMYKELVRTKDPNCKICNMANFRLQDNSKVQNRLAKYRNDSKVKYHIYDKFFWYNEDFDPIIEDENKAEAKDVIGSMRKMLKDKCTVEYKGNSGYDSLQSLSRNK